MNNILEFMNDYSWSNVRLEYNNLPVKDLNFFKLKNWVNLSTHCNILCAQNQPGENETLVDVMLIYIASCGTCPARIGTLKRTIQVLGAVVQDQSQPEQRLAEMITHFRGWNPTNILLKSVNTRHWTCHWTNVMDELSMPSLWPHLL